MVVRSLIPSRFHFPASLRSTVITRFLAPPDALTSAGRFFGPLSSMNAALFRRGSSLLIPTPFPVIPSPIIRCVRQGFSLSPVFFPPGTLACGLSLSTVSRRSLGLGSRFRVYIARSPITPYRIEFTAGALQPRALRTGSSLSVALHGRISPPQFLSAAGPVDFGLTGTSTPLRCRLRSRTMPPPTGLN